jgi:hypothetical protein
MTEPRINILLVDDRSENLLALQAALEELGHRLVTATSGSRHSGTCCGTSSH